MTTNDTSQRPLATGKTIDGASLARSEPVTTHGTLQVRVIRLPSRARRRFAVDWMQRSPFEDEDCMDTFRVF